MTGPKPPNRVRQFAGDRLGVPPRQSQEQQHLQHLMIGQCLGAGGQQARAHAVAMTVRALFGDIVRRDAEQIAGVGRFGNALRCVLVRACRPSSSRDEGNGRPRR